MADVSFSQLKTRFNTWLRDSDNRTFTSAEKTEILKSVINDDPSVVSLERDDSLTTSANTPSYPLPGGFTNVAKMEIDINGDGFPLPVDRAAFDVVGNTIYIDHSHKGIPTGKTIVLWGIKKLTDADQIPDYVQGYALHMAMAQAFEMLKTSLTTRFVKNDITMAEIINSINTHLAAAARAKGDIQNRIQQVV